MWGIRNYYFKIISEENRRFFVNFYFSDYPFPLSDENRMLVKQSLEQLFISKSYFTANKGILNWTHCRELYKVILVMILRGISDSQIIYLIIVFRSDRNRDNGFTNMFEAQLL